MKKHRFTKFLLALLLLGGATGLASCASSGYDARIPTSECNVTVTENADTHKKTAVVTLGIENNTIYDVKAAEITYDVYANSIRLNTEPITDRVEVYVRHGVAGYLTYTVPIEQYQMITSVKITGATVTEYRSFWDTYVVPFVVMFVVSGLALVFAAIDIFTHQWSKESLRQMLSEKLSLYLIIFAMTILICLIPLMFSNWVVTLILVGGFAGVALLTGIMTAIRVATIK